MPFRVVNGVGRRMGVLDKGRDRRRGRGSFVGKYGASHYNQLGTVAQLRSAVRGGDAALPKLLWDFLFLYVHQTKQ